MTRSRRIPTALSLAVAVIVALGASASPAFAAGEAHQLLHEFGHNATEAFSNPNGIAIDESTGDVYVADIGTNTVYKFDASGNAANFSALGSNALTHSFSFPSVYGSPAAIAVDNSGSPSDPSAGDLYVMDAGNGVIDKFNAEGKYLSQMGGFGDELLGLGVDGSGTVHVDLASGHLLVIDEFDDAAVNHLIASQVLESENEASHKSGIPNEPKAHGFAVSATGDDYPMYEPSCSCTLKFGQKLSPLGSVDGSGAGDVAVAVDPATGDFYADDQSSVAEWDTGAMNRDSSEVKSAGTLVTRFGSPELSGSSGQGGIAVNGKTGEIYVSNPANGEVYVFGSDAPSVTVSEPADVTREAASLSGAIDPRGVAVSSCAFEYGLTNEFGEGLYSHSVPCAQTPAGIGAGSSPVAVSAQLVGLEPGELYHFRLITTNANGAGEASGMLPTQGVGFGIKNYEINFLNENGTPDTQAGSHPFKFVDLFTLNSHFKRQESNADSPYIRLPDGVLRNVKIDLPPGFVGDPNAPSQHCTGQQLELEFSHDDCPPEAHVGTLQLKWSENSVRQPKLESPVFAMAPVRGVALQLGSNFLLPLLYLNNGVLAGGNYPVQTTVTDAPTSAPVISSKAVLYGVLQPCVLLPGNSNAGGKYEEGCQEEGTDTRFERGPGPRKALLTMPTGCHGPLRSTMEADSWEEPGKWAEKSTVTHNVAGTPVSLTGCSKLKFPPEISVASDSSDASTSSGLTVNVHVPQTAAFNPDGLAESSLRDTTVVLPEGVAINPAGSDGLEACTSNAGALVEGALGSPGDQIGYKGQQELNGEGEPGVKWSTFTPELPSLVQPGMNFCPNGSKIGTVKIKTPLLEHEVEGAVYLASQNSNPFGSLVAMYIVAEDPYSGSLIKLTGEVSLNPDTGQVVAAFKNTPDVPFENLELHFFGGERAPLSTPSRCGTYTTKAVFTPWDGNGPVTSESSFKIDHGPHGGLCPGASLPFEAALAAGTTSNQAGGFTPFSMTMSREDGNQNLSSIQLHMPPGLSGTLSNVKLCSDAQANEGTCPEDTLIGETTVSVGIGNDPFTVKGGKVYITEKYEGAPFGLSIVNPAKAGPFDLEKTPAHSPACDCLVVRAKIEVDPLTAALTIVSNPPGTPYSIPTIIEGVPLEIKHINVSINHLEDFTFNPTNCDKMAITGTLLSTEGSSDQLSVPFQATNCAALSFKPGFAVSTQAKTSRVEGASLTAKLTYPNVGGHSILASGQANIAKVKIELPKQLPSRLSTLQKACTAKVFDANPAACPTASTIGFAKATTPLLPGNLEGPAYFVSNGSAKFPELIVVLTGYQGVTVDLHGETFISKAGITSSTFATVPDVPVGTFELTLPEGPNSALAANGNLCTANLAMPTEFLSQSGVVIKQSTKISVTGCKKSIKVIKHKKKAKGKKASITVAVPSAGTLTASGTGLSKASAKASGAGRVTVNLALLGGEQAFLARHHGRQLAANIKLTFTPNRGKALSSSVTLMLG